MIPVLGIPYISQRHLLDAALGSVDVPVETTVLVDNSAEAELANLSRPRTRVFAMRHNLGVAASWNLIMKATPAAPWWLIANSDIAFGAGSLQRLAAFMDGFDGLVAIRSFAAFAVSASAVERVGWFDENFVPAYFEDNDYRYRCKLAGVPVCDLEDARVRHESSATIRLDVRLARENERTFPANAAYYREKWGGDVGDERFTTPFDQGWPCDVWRLSVERLAGLSWR